MTSSFEKDLQKSAEMYKQIDDMIEAAHKLLEPYSEHIASRIKNEPDMSIVVLRELLAKMPQSFARAELRGLYYSLHPESRPIH